jgi:hypothetical protein
MRKLTLPLTESDFETRGKRRRIANILAGEIMRLYEAESAYKERIPPNFRSSYRYLYASRAESDLFDAAITLYEAFEPF